MLFRLILKEELRWKKLLLLILSPILLFVFQVVDSFAYIKYFEAILPTFYIFIIFSSLVYLVESKMDELEGTMPYDSFKVDFQRQLVNFFLFIVNILYNYLIISLVIGLKFNVEGISVGNNGFSGISSSSILISAILSLIFYTAALYFIQTLSKSKWLALSLTFIFAVVNMVGMNRIKLNSIYYYGDRWLYVKSIYILISVLVLVLLWNYEKISFRVKRVKA